MFYEFERIENPAGLESTVCAFAILIYFMMPQVKYLAYAMLVSLPVYSVLAQRNFQVHAAILVYVILNCALWYTSRISAGYLGINQQSVKDLFLPFLGALPFLFGNVWNKTDFLIFSFAVILVLSLHAFQAQSSGLTGAVSFTASTGYVEHVLAFPLGLLLFFYLGVHRSPMTLLVFFFLLVAWKRSALLGVAVGFVAYWIVHMIGSQRHLLKWVILAVQFFIFLIAINMLAIYSYVDGLGIFEKDINSFSMGRLRFSLLSDRILDSNSFSQWIFGNGTTYRHAFVSSEWRGGLGMSWENVRMAHNDHVKIIIEFGVLGFLGLSYWSALVYSTSKILVGVFAYLSVVFLFDNTYVYWFVQIPLFAIIVHEFDRVKQKSSAVIGKVQCD